MSQNNPDLVSEAFSKQSAVFDKLDEENPLSAHLRKIFRKEVEKHSSPGSSILELNCGTGIDALYFASRGYKVTATDNAPGMIAELKKKRENSAFSENLNCRRLSYHDLGQLAPQTFDHIISNYGGLNCTADLNSVLHNLSGLLNPGGTVTLVIMPRICPWELAMVLKGKFSTAFRRFKKRTIARVEGMPFECYYYNPSYVLKHMKQEFDLLSLKGIYITVPPEFYRNFVERYPRIYRFLSATDALISGVFPFNHACDHFMISMKKKDTV